MVKGNGSKRQNHSDTKKSSSSAKAPPSQADAASTVDNSDEEEDMEERMDVQDCIESMLDKKASTRAAAYQGLIDFLRSPASINACESLNEMLEEPSAPDGICIILLRLLKKTTVSEVKLILTLLPLCALLVGAEQDSFYMHFHATLGLMVRGGKKALKGVGPMSLFCLTFSCFVCANFEYRTKVWNFCEDLMCAGTDRKVTQSDSDSDTESKSSDGSGWAESSDSDSEDGIDADDVDEAIKMAAAQCWVTLGTLMEPEKVLQHSRERGVFETMTRLLYQSREVDDKIMAGRCLAFLWESADEYAQLEELVTDAETELELRNGLVCDDPDEVAALLLTLKEMSKDSLRNLKKKERKEQRSEFREIEDWIVKGEKPFTGSAEYSMRVQGAVVDVDSFARLNIVDTLKRVLGSGFHSSLHAYPVVRDILEVDEVTAAMDGDGLQEKVDKGSYTEKRRAINRQQDRRQSQLNKEYSLTEPP